MGRGFIKDSEVSLNSNLRDIKVLESREDVSTLLKVYDEVVEQGVSQSQILGVKEDSNRSYVFVVGSKKSAFGFDLITFINTKYHSRKVTNANIRLLFPVDLSRGNDGSKSGVGKGIPRLFYEKENLLITVPKDSSVTIGRSDKRSDFVIKGNGNVSRAQCKAYYDKRKGSLILVDCDSAHGTFVNRKRVGPEGELIGVGDVISFVGEKLLVVK